MIEPTRVLPASMIPLQPTTCASERLTTIVLPVVWALKDGTLGQTRERAMIEPTRVRDPDSYALKPKHVRQITRNLRGPADTWKPPAGLYVENSKCGLNMDMWALRRSKTEPTFPSSLNICASVVHAAGLPSNIAAGPKGAARDAALESERSQRGSTDTDVELLIA